jgi:hypothetical protein
MKQTGGAGNWPGNPGSTGKGMPSMATGAKAMQTVSQRVISDAHLLDDALYEDESAEIATLLSSTVTSQKLDGLKRLIACISVGRDVSDFFPNVVVNVAHVPFEVLPASRLRTGGWPRWVLMGRFGPGAKRVRLHGGMPSGSTLSTSLPSIRHAIWPLGVCGAAIGDPGSPPPLDQRRSPGCWAS